MVVTNWAKQALTYAIGSTITNNYISYCAIGSGSGTALGTQTTLIGEAKRTAITGSPDFTTTYQVEFQADFNSIQMSGINLSEYGFISSGAFQIGSIWQREAFGSVAFDGTSELQLLANFEVY